MGCAASGLEVCYQAPLESDSTPVPGSDRPHVPIGSTPKSNGAVVQTDVALTVQNSVDNRATARADVIPKSFLETDFAFSLIQPVDEELHRDLACADRWGSSLEETTYVSPIDGEVDQSPVAMCPEKMSGKGLLQESFSSKGQTVIVFDWDDTIFPSTTYRKYMNNLPGGGGLDSFGGLGPPICMQAFTALTKWQVTTLQELFAESDAVGLELLKTASALGHVVVVTLASRQWFQLSGSNFLPKCVEFIESDKVEVVHAQDGNTEPWNPEGHPSEENYFIQYWGLLKGRAIGQEVKNFYSRSDCPNTGSWENVISIGDSVIERYGTLLAVAQYVENIRNAEPSWKFRTTNPNLFEYLQDGKLVNVRAKVFKMMDFPSLPDLVTQVKLVLEWLPKMVFLDGGFDLGLPNLSESTIEKVQQRLKEAEVYTEGLDQGTSDDMYPYVGL